MLYVVPIRVLHRCLVETKRKKEKKMKKVISVVMIMCLLALVMTGCGSNNTDVQQTETSDPIVLKFNTVINESHACWPMMQEFEQNVEAESDGRIDVQLYPSSQLGGDREAYEALGLGELEMHYSGSFVLGNFTDKTKFWTLPFFFAGGLDAMYDFFDVYGDEITQGIVEDCGIYPVWLPNGAFNPNTKGKAITKPDDMKGVKYRVHELDQFVAGYENLGAIPVVMTTAEVYTGLQQGAINGAHSEAQMMLTGKYYEVTDNYTAMNMAVDMSLWGISQKFLDSLDDDLKEIVIRNAEKGCNDYKVAYSKIVEDTYAQLEELGMTITYLDKAQMQVFQDAVKGQYEAFENSGIEPKFAEYYAAVQDINANYIK